MAIARWVFPVPSLERRDLRKLGHLDPGAKSRLFAGVEFPLQEIGHPGKADGFFLFCQDVLQFSGGRGQAEGLRLISNGFYIHRFSTFFELRVWRSSD